MGRRGYSTIDKYIIRNLSHSFFIVFFPLFVIASLVFAIKLSGYTSVIKITMSELFRLYLYGLPELLFYILPFSFFITASLAIHRLSMENETIVLFALGIKPSKLLSILLRPAFLLSVVLIFDFFVLLPLTKVMFRSFVDQKQAEGQFNISASEAGHKFGDWLVFVEQKNLDNTLKNVVLFKPDEIEETLVHSKKAEVVNKNSIMSLELENGKSYSYSKEMLRQVQFKKMAINHKLLKEGQHYKATLEYWLDEGDRSYKIKKFTTSFLLAVFPLLSLFSVLSIALVKARHSHSHIYLWLFAIVMIYFIGVFSLSTQLGLYAIVSIIPVWLTVTYFIYNKKILLHY